MPLTVCLCQPIWVMISSSVAPFLRWSIATTLAVLLPSRGPALSSVLAAFLALGAFLAAVVLLVALAFLPDFGLAGSAEGDPSGWQRNRRGWWSWRRLLQIGRGTRLNSSHRCISYAVF